MAKDVICKNCGAVNKHYSTFCTRAPRKRPNHKGKHTLEYEEWRDTVAIPYLDKNFGHICIDCGVGGSLDVDHVLPRGSHPHLKMDLSNVMYRCRICHIRKTNYGGV